MAPTTVDTGASDIRFGHTRILEFISWHFMD